MFDDVLDGEVDTEKSVYCENIFEGGHIEFFQRGKPMHGFESKLESFSVIVCVQNIIRKDV